MKPARLFAFLSFAFLFAVALCGGCAAMSDAWHTIANAPAESYQTAGQTVDGVAAVLPAFGPWGVFSSLLLSSVSAGLYAYGRSQAKGRTAAEAVVVAANDHPASPPIVAQVPAVLAAVASAIVDKAAAKGGAA